MLGGAVVSVKAAQLIVESDAELELCVSALFGAGKPTSKSALHHSSKLKRELLKMLLEVYTIGG
jgi:hypothetical protein